MSSRDAILSRLRQTQGSTSYSVGADQFTEMSELTGVERFIELTHENDTTTERAQGWQEVPAKVAAYLSASGLPLQVVAGAIEPLEQEAWEQQGVGVSAGPLQSDGDVYMSECYGAVAENGTIALATSDGHAISHEFLALTHIVLLRTDRVFAGLSDLWQALRADAADGDGHLPRELCLVTGPSRTADLGVPAKLGAHGPARVHVVVVEA